MPKRLAGEKNAGPIKIEVVADSSGEWCGNGLRFDTPEEAEEYGNDLFQRWTLVTKVRWVNDETGETKQFV